MQESSYRSAVASMVLGIVSVSLFLPAVILSFFHWKYSLVFATISLICGIVAIVFGAKAKMIKPAGRAIAGFVLGIVGTSISGILINLLMVLCFFF